jgi:hypothetical protein
MNSAGDDSKVWHGGMGRYIMAASRLRFKDKESLSIN